MSPFCFHRAFELLCSRNRYQKTGLPLLTATTDQGTRPSGIDWPTTALRLVPPADSGETFDLLFYLVDSSLVKTLLFVVALLTIYIRIYIYIYIY